MFLQLQRTFIIILIFLLQLKIYICKIAQWKHFEERGREMTGGSETQSRVSLAAASLKQSASQLPRRKVFHWVAQWFTIPQLVTKILSFVSERKI